MIGVGRDVGGRWYVCLIWVLLCVLCVCGRGVEWCVMVW